MSNEVNVSILRDLIGRSGSESKPSPKKVEVSKANESQVEVKDTEKVEFTTQDLEHAVEKLNEYISSVERDLKFSVAENSGTTIITVVDSQTEEVVRQIPSEEVLKLAEVLQSTGGLVNEQA